MTELVVPKPDQGRWGNMAQASLDEAVLLSLDIDPALIQRPEFRRMLETSGLRKNVEKRLQIARSHEWPYMDSDGNRLVALSDFRKWGESLPIPFTFPEWFPTPKAALRQSLAPSVDRNVVQRKMPRRRGGQPTRRSKIVLPWTEDGFYSVGDIPELLANAVHAGAGLRDLIIGRYVRRDVRYFYQEPSRPIPTDAVDPEDYQGNQAIADSVSWSSGVEVEDEADVQRLDSVFDRTHGRGASKTPSEQEAIAEEVKDEALFMQQVAAINAIKKFEKNVLAAIGKNELRTVDPETLLPPDDWTASSDPESLWVAAEDLRAWFAAQTGCEVSIGDDRTDSGEPIEAAQTGAGGLTIPKVDSKELDLPAEAAEPDLARLGEENDGSDSDELYSSENKSLSRGGALHRVIQESMGRAGGIEASNAVIWAELVGLAEAEAPPEPLRGRVPGKTSGGRGGIKYVTTSGDEKVLSYSNLCDRLLRLRSKGNYSAATRVNPR